MNAILNGIQTGPAMSGGKTTDKKTLSRLTSPCN
jgi:hypothetical protein